MLDSFQRGERLSASKLNTYKRQIERNKAQSNDGVVSPQGVSSGRARRITPSSVDSFDRFRITKAASTEVRVGQGKWTRNAEVLSSDVDSGENYLTITGLSANSTTYYITARITNTGGLVENGLLPNDLTITAETSLPTETNIQTNEYWVLGTAETNADGVVTTITQYWLGDIDDIGWMPDAKTTLTSETPYSRSIDIKAAGTHGYEAILFDFVSPAGAPTWERSTDQFVMRDDDRTNGGTNGPDVVYATRVEIVEDLLDGDQYLTNYIESALTGVFEHTNLDFTNSTSGQAGQNADHDDRYWYRYAVPADVNGNSFHTTGECRANDFYIQDDSGNYWGNAGWQFRTSTGSPALASITGAGSTINIGSSTSITLDTETLNLSASIAANYNGTAGRTITNWTDIGGLTGTTVQTYTIRTLPAGGGPPLEIEVLGRPA